MNNKKVFVFDLDGTYLSNDHDALPETITAIKFIKEKGHIPIIATGRPLQDIVGIISGYELFDYFICNNGTYAVKNDQEKHKIFKHSIPVEIARNFAKVAKEYGCFFAIHTSDRTYHCKTTDKLSKAHEKIIEEEWNSFGELDSIDDFEKFVKDTDIYQVTIRTWAGKALEVYKEIKDEFSKGTAITVSASDYIDVNPKFVSKYSGVKEISKILNISLDNFYVFGDSLNDYEMLKNIKNSFCMENGIEEAKKIANKVIGKNTTPAIANEVKEILR